MNIRQIRKSLGAIKQFFFDTQPNKFGAYGKNVYIEYPLSIHNPKNVFLANNTSIKAGSMIINTTGKFIMKENSTSAQRLTVVTGNHHSVRGHFLYESITTRLADVEKDVIVEEDALIGVNVILLCGVTIGRGCIVGAGSVVRTSTPPYSIVIGNPAQVIKFIFTPEEIIEHERILYPEEKRLPLELLQKNYKCYTKR